MKFAEYMQSAERAYFDALLRAHNGNMSRVAEEAGLHRESLYKMFRRNGLDPQEYRSGREVELSMRKRVRILRRMQESLPRPSLRE